MYFLLRHKVTKLFVYSTAMGTKMLEILFHIKTQYLLCFVTFRLTHLSFVHCLWDFSSIFNALWPLVTTVNLCFYDPYVKIMLVTSGFFFNFTAQFWLSYSQLRFSLCLSVCTLASFISTVSILICYLWSLQVYTRLKW